MLIVFFADGRITVITSKENASYIRYRCCKMPRTIGQIFADDKLEDVKVWEGYYCPESLDLTGRPRYTLDRYFGPDQLFAESTSDDETTDSTLLQMSSLDSRGALQSGTSITTTNTTTDTTTTLHLTVVDEMILYLNQSKQCSSKRPSVDWPGHPCITANHPYGFLPLKVPPPPCAVILV